VSRGVFVTGTDTAVGKTVAACALLHALRARGVRVAPMKPVAAGALGHDGVLANEDSLALMRAAGWERADLDDVTPVLLREAMAPHIAAYREGRRITLEPVREAFVESLGVRIHVVEWGDPDAEPLLCCHGFWDHARSFAVLGPLLAERYRVIALDARGHGDSDRADAYSWGAHIRDIVAVAAWIGRPLHLIGHSMGGGQVIDTAIALPDQVRRVVNIDGFGPPPISADEEARTAERFTGYLEQRRAVAQRPDWRPYDRLEQLIERRKAQNPRLSAEWLRYFVFHAARQADDGWRWKADPLLGQGFGPWRPDWIEHAYARLQQPLLAVTGSEQDTWGPLPEGILGPRLARVPRLTRATVAGAGHFVHMERPRETAALLRDWLEA